MSIKNTKHNLTREQIEKMRSLVWDKKYMAEAVLRVAEKMAMAIERNQRQERAV